MRRLPLLRKLKMENCDDGQRSRSAATPVARAKESTSNSRVSANEVLCNVARHVNWLVKTCSTIEKTVKTQEISISEIKKEVKELRSSIKAKQRNEYTLKGAGHEV